MHPRIFLSHRNTWCEGIHRVPSNETPHYPDFSKDLEQLLKLDFGKSLKALEIEVLIYSFSYEDGEKERPYIEEVSFKGYDSQFI